MQITIADIQLQANEDYTLPTAEVAKFYDVDVTTIRTHKRLHSDELIENQHFIFVLDERNRKRLYWTLEGVYMLGFFIKSERAKKYRKAVAKLLKEIKQGNLKVTKNFDEATQKLLNTLKAQSEELLSYKREIYELKDKLIEQLMLNVELLKQQSALRVKRQAWSKEEEQKLIELYSSNVPLQEISKILNRNIASIRGKVNALMQKGVLK